ncbi:MAG: PilZ domain-containing protein [Bryobacteraceae bacterium]
MIEQRRSKRFDLDLKVEVVRAGTERLSQVGRTRNISSGGILFTSGSRMELGGPLEYIVTLCTGTGGNVNLRCMGKVLRIEENFANGTGGGNFTVAVSLERYEFMRNSHLS